MENFKKSIGFLVLGFLVGLFSTYLFLNNPDSTGEFSNLEKNLTELKKDKEFYMSLGQFATLLDAQDYSYFSKVTDEASESGLEEKMNEMFVLISVNELFKDEKIKNTVLSLKNKIEDEKNKAPNKDTFFEKNTACANLTGAINSQLVKDEKLEFIFYSPTKNSCLYATQYTFNSYGEEYYTYVEKRIYNGSTHSKIDTYNVYYYNYPYLSEEEEESRTKNARAAYVKFILENSGYNADLLKDISYIYL